MAAVALIGRAPSQFSVGTVTLADPGDDGNDREYLLVDCEGAPCSSSTRSNLVAIHETQAVAPSNGKYSSYFVGSRIISNPALHISSRVDPLFFALEYFQRKLANEDSKLETFQPYDQALEGMNSLILRALGLDPKLVVKGKDGPGQLLHICEANDMCGDDLILIKFSRQRTTAWLKMKFENALAAVRKRVIERKRWESHRASELTNLRGGNGAFSSSFALEEDTPKMEASDAKGLVVDEEVKLTCLEETQTKVEALQLVCDYLPTYWQSQLREVVGVKAEDIEQKFTKTGKRSRESWEGAVGQEDSDALVQFSQGLGSAGSKAVTPGAEKKCVRNAQSHGLKRLAKVNKKGMKSLSSFFGAKKKK